MKRSLALSLTAFALTLAASSAPRRASHAPRQTKKAEAAAHGAGDAAKGKATFEQCAVCHSAETEEKKMGPTLKGLFKREKMQNGQKVSEETVLNQINNGGGGMPAYSDMLSATEKQDLLAYLKTL